jgi:RND family efflux transporter MFP subunit
MLAKPKLAISVLSAAPMLLTLGVLLSATIGCERAHPAGADQPVPKVTTSEVTQQETTDFDEYTGTTEASEAVEVRARVFGYLKSIEFHDGDFVKEGQTLFTIEPDEYDAIHQQSLSKIAVWEAKLEVAQANLARRKALLATPGAVSREEYEQYAAAAREAEASLNAAKADANRTAVDLKYTVVKAPISGRIDRAMVTKGTLLTGGTGSGTLLTKIVDEQPMYVYFDVDERSLLRYMKRRNQSVNSTPGSLRQLGIDCYVQLADEKDFSHKGKLDFAESEVNTSTGTARLRGEFENKDLALASGLFVRVRVPSSEPYRALLIPERALATDQDIKFVYVVGNDGVAARRKVELGAQRGDLRVVTAGLQAGERVIVKGLQRVRPGQKVEPEPEPSKVTVSALVKPIAQAALRDDHSSGPQQER